MSLSVQKRPGRYVRYCDSEILDLCAYISLSDFVIPPWGLSAGAFASMTLSPDPLGIIASIDSHPTAYLYNASSVNVATLTWSGTAYTTTAEVDMSASTFFFIQIQAIAVTLKDGSVCSYDLTTYFSAEGPTVEIPEWQLTTNKQTSFTVNRTSSAGTVDWGDGSTSSYTAPSAANISHTYADPGTYVVQWWPNNQDTSQIEAINEGLITLNISNCDNLSSLEVQTNSGLTTISPPALNTATWTKFLAYSCNLTGSLNLAALTKLGGRFEVYSNANLTGLVLPVSTQVFTTFLAYSCNLTGTISIQYLTGLAGVVQFNNNSLLTAILWPASTGTLTRLHLNSTGWIGECDLQTVTVTTDFEMRSCSAMTHITFKNSDVPTGGWTMTNFATYLSTNATGELDVSMFNISGSFQIYSCDWTSLVTNPSNTGNITLCRLDGNLFAGNLDLSDWNTNGTLNFSSNPALETVTHSANSGSISGYYGNSCILTYYDTTMLNFGSTATIEFQNNAMTAAEVNHFLVDLDSNLGAGTGTIRLAGTNAAPDLSSGGYDGTTAKVNLIIKGWSVTTN